MSDRTEPGSPYTLTFGLGVAADLAALHAVEAAALDAAQAILDDLAHGLREAMPEPARPSAFFHYCDRW